jgi:acetyltransferase
MDIDDAAEMLKELKSYPLFAGLRGLPPLDIDGIRDMLVNVSRLLQEQPGIIELDINPVRVYQDGCLALDARILSHDIPHSNHKDSS